MCSNKFLLFQQALLICASFHGSARSMRLTDPATANDSAELELRPWIINNLDSRNQGATAPWEDSIKQAPLPAASSGHGGNVWAMCSNKFLLFQQALLICASFHGSARSMRLTDPATANDSAELELRPWIINNLDSRNQGATAPWEDSIKQAPLPAASSGHGGNVWTMCSNKFLLFQQYLRSTERDLPLHKPFLPASLKACCTTAPVKMNRGLGMDLLAAVAVAIAMIIMAPNEAAALGGGVGGPDGIGRKK
ncbi:uncharacterized protein [Dermacentor albipictus]|uniref:uncharacterized protein n=1 Tax=Dermacentor albipictus TaxID=60249 RepID=UPI0038FC7BF7